MSSSFSHNIVLRMGDCLKRQIVWYGTLCEELLAISKFLDSDEDFEEPTLSDLVEKAEGFGKRSRVLEEEFHALKREWDESDSILPAEREEIRAMGMEAEVLSAEVATLYTRNEELAQRHASSKRAEMATMQRLSASLHKYRTDDDDRMSFLDRKA